MLKAAEVDDVLDMLERHFKERLSEWEEGFVASCRRQRTGGATLSPKQLDKLDEVSERVAREYSRGG